MSDQSVISKDGLVPCPDLAVIYECPSNSTAVISLITITNESDNYIIEVRKIVNGGASRLLFRFLLDEGDIVKDNDTINLNAGEQIVASSDKNTTEYIVEGIETFLVQ